jgi:UMF1 family MFS transporter
MEPVKPAPTREVVAWAMYDWANSAFATSILAFVYQPYFSLKVVPADYPVRGETLWSWANALSMGLVCVAGPVIGAITDYTASKKRFFVVFWLLGSLSCGGLVFVHPGDVALGLALFVLANLGFGASVAINNAFLTELVPAEKIDRVSSFGWAVGYFGGLLCLVLNLGMLSWMSDQGRALRWGFGVVGLWWFLFSLPCVFWLRERASPRARPAGRSIVAQGFADVARTLRNLRFFKVLFVFLLAYLFFNGGVETVITNAANFGTSTAGLTQRQVIVCGLAIQLIAAAGAFAFGRLSERVGTKRVIRASLWFWLAGLALAFFTRSHGMFWVLAVVLGIVLGGTQALSRGYFAQLTPPAKAAEFFGFFAIAGKGAAALGSLLFGAVHHLTGKMTWGILSLAIFFVLGMILLAKVDDRAGKEAARAESLP